jgi:DNA-binding IclR family transcriptional regulator
MSIDETKLNEFMGKIVGDLGVTMSGALLVLGDRLGLYKALAASGPVTPDELARRTETSERYVREWLNAQAASGYVTYEPATGRYTLPPEQAFALANDESPASVAGAFHMARAMCGVHSTRWRRTFAAVAGSSGDTSIIVCLKARSASFVPATSATS